VYAAWPRTLLLQLANYTGKHELFARGRCLIHSFVMSSNRVQSCTNGVVHVQSGLATRTYPAQRGLVIARNRKGNKKAQVGPCLPSCTCMHASAAVGATGSHGRRAVAIITGSVPVTRAVRQLMSKVLNTGCADIEYSKARPAGRPHLRAKRLHDELLDTSRARQGCDP
jgi:hypothetical protein